MNRCMMQIKNNEFTLNSASEVRVSGHNTGDQSSPVNGVVVSENSQETLSSLAQRLSAAEQRASARDSQLSRKELTALAASIREKVYGASYDFNKAKHDAELPSSDDPEWLASARQATDFINGRSDNPFFGMSAQQLSVIAYDEGGSFTTNERQAAMIESGRQYSEWSKSVVGKMWDEYQQRGKSTEGLKEILAYYKALPAIEESRYGNYEAEIMLQLDLQEIDWPEFNTSLLDMVANEWKPANEREDAAGDESSAKGLGNEASPS